VPMVPEKYEELRVYRAQQNTKRYADAGTRTILTLWPWSWTFIKI